MIELEPERPGWARHEAPAREPGRDDPATGDAEGGPSPLHSPGGTAVERFARQHDQTGVLGPGRFYHDLIPLSSPGPGQQYAFEVDLDACSGCKACVAACHSLNGLDDDESWREVGLLVGGSFELPVLQHVTGSCHHCLEPACAEGCPVNAYEKDAITGIVRHLDDQCIGCRYCLLTCPYDAPKYNRRLGIVRKCDMCSLRLSVGEAPACAQACPNRAIRIRVVDRERVLEDSEANVFLPGAPAPEYTLPTTLYRTRRAPPRNLLPADYHDIAPQPAHWPLIVMLVLTQLSVGGFLMDWLLGSPTAMYGGWAPLHWDGRGSQFSVLSSQLSAAGAQLRAEELELKNTPVFWQALISLGLGVLALGASIFHLGRPWYAFRVVVGLKTSWLSREIIAFGLFAVLAAVHASWRIGIAVMPGGWASALAAAVVVAGLFGVFCSVMVYHQTRRTFWRGGSSGTRFLSTVVILGSAVSLLAWGLGTPTPMYGDWGPPALQLERPNSPVSAAAGSWLCALLAIVTGAKLVHEALVFRHLRDHRQSALKRAATLMAGPLRRPLVARFTLGMAGGIIFPLLLMAAGLTSSTLTLTLVVAVFLLTISAEVLERYLFFSAAHPCKMPGS